MEESRAEIAHAGMLPWGAVLGVSLAAAALFVVSLGFGLVVPLLPSMPTGGAPLGPEALAGAFVAYAAAKIATQLPGGVWADRLGAARVLRAGLALFAASLVALAMAPLDPTLLAAIRLIEGAATGVVYPAVSAIAVEAGPAESSGRRLGLVLALGASGMIAGAGLLALAPLVPSGLAAALGLEAQRLPILVVALAAAAVAASTFALTEGRPRAAARRSLGDELAHVVEVVSDRRLLAVAIAIGWNKLTFSALQGLMPIALRDEGRTVTEIGLVFLLIGLTFGAAQAGFGALADRAPTRPLVVGGLVVAAAALGAAGGRAVPLVGGFFVYVAATSLVFAAGLKAAGQRGQATQGTGTAFGAVGTATDLMTVVGPAVFLPLWGRAGGAVALGAMVGAAVVAMALVLFVGKAED
jgi:predicted MFS family arabinose efflux permease